MTGSRHFRRLRSRPYPLAVDWRITFFVSDAERTQDGWTVRGEVGLGPPAVGDCFSFVQHPGSDEERDVLRVEDVTDSSLRLSGGTGLTLTKGDILGGEVQRPDRV